MTSSFRALALTCAFLLAACGGGGGGSGPSVSTAAPSVAQAVTITESNAKPVAASALDATQSTSATGSASDLPIAVQVGTPAAASGGIQLIAPIRTATGVKTPTTRQYVGPDAIPSATERRLSFGPSA